MIAVVAVTAAGRRWADHLVSALPNTGTFASVQEAWPAAEALVLCMATGAAVRLVAPLLADKHTDPPVVTVDEAGRHAVVLTGAHHGGNRLAEEVARALGATPVITTATDASGLPALDQPPFGLQVDPASRGAVARVTTALLDGEAVWRHRTRPWPTGPLPGDVRDADAPRTPGIVVTDELIEVAHPTVVLRPPSLVVGVGSARGVSADEVGGLIDAALAQGDLAPDSVTRVATVDLKADEAGILTAAEQRGWSVTCYPAQRLNEVVVPNPSDVVLAEIGTASVAEAAALVEGGELVVAKQKSANATVAVARIPVRGRLALVSTGPGDPDLVPELARAALANAEVVVGLDQYVDRIRQWLRPGCQILASPIGDEVARADQAIAAARTGRSTALISGGDVGVYAMASPTLERAGDDIEVTVVPGVTAAVAAAALLGSPLGHDHCAISLSDLLTPWEVIRRRVKAAAEGDFVVSFYNPRSRARTWQLDEARLLLLEHRKPDTPVGVITDASRPTQQVHVTTLGDLDTADVGMLSIVVVGNSQTRMIAGRMVTPRGYA